MSFKFKISKVTLSGSEQIDFLEEGIILIVGPNNSGKSTFLREIKAVIENGLDSTAQFRKVISEIHFTNEGDDNEFDDYISSTMQKYLRGDGQAYVRSLGIDISESLPQTRWRHWKNGFQEIARLIITYADTINRLGAANPAATINFLSDTPQNPIHALYLNEELENKISVHLQEAFGEELILNRGAGSVLPLQYW